MIPKVTTIVHFGFGSAWIALLSGDRYFRGVVTFGKK